jgi:hypothetical protein
MVTLDSKQDQAQLLSAGDDAGPRAWTSAEQLPPALVHTVPYYIP